LKGADFSWQKILTILAVTEESLKTKNSKADLGIASFSAFAR
jgi:hypothetical protein